MRTVQIDRHKNLSREAFLSGYAQGSGLPVVITEAIDNWPARWKWTLEYLKSTYGDDTVLSVAGMLSKAVRVAKLGAYIDHMEDPSKPLRGFWVDPVSNLPVARPVEEPAAPLYMLGWNAFQRHPEFYKDVEPAPDFIDDWVGSLTPALRDALERASGREFWSVYMGTEGSQSRLHVDFWRTHSYLAQIHGGKRCLLFSPEDSAFVYEGRVDPTQPDFERFPLLRMATAYETVIGPGDTLYTPPGWWHDVRGLESSVTVSHNFFNEMNFAEYLAALTAALPELAATLRKSSYRLRRRCR